MLKVRLCLPFYLDFDGAKSGLRELKARGKKIDTWIYQYADIEWHVEPRRGVFPRCRVRNSLTEITHLGKFRNTFIQFGNRGQVEEFDYFLFVDSDIIWSIEDAVRLVGHGLDVCGGPYPGHVDETVHQAGFWAAPGVIRERLPVTTTGVKQVDFIATGFLCVKRRVFDILEYPWFRHPLVQMDGYQEELGEDYGFCLLCRDRFYVHADCDIKLKHAPQPAVDWSF